MQALPGTLCGEASRNDRRDGRREAHARWVRAGQRVGRGLNPLHSRLYLPATPSGSLESRVSFLRGDRGAVPECCTGQGAARKNDSNTFVILTEVHGGRK